MRLTMIALSVKASEEVDVPGPLYLSWCLLVVVVVILRHRHPRPGRRRWRTHHGRSSRLGALMPPAPMPRWWRGNCGSPTRSWWPTTPMPSRGRSCRRRARPTVASGRGTPAAHPPAPLSPPALVSHANDGGRQDRRPSSLEAGSGVLDRNRSGRTFGGCRCGSFSCLTPPIGLWGCRW